MQTTIKSPHIVCTTTVLHLYRRSGAQGFVAGKMDRVIHAPLFGKNVGHFQLIAPLIDAHSSSCVGQWKRVIS